MKVLIPLAGKGTRLRPQTHAKAKPLVHLAGKRVLEHIIDQVLPIEPEEFLIVHDRRNGDQVKKFLSERYPDLRFSYAVQAEQKGNADAIYQARDYVSPGDELLIMFCDSILVTDFEAIRKIPPHFDGLFFSNVVSDPQNYGVLAHDGMLVTGLEEKPDNPKSNMTVVGVYYFRDGYDAMHTYVAKVMAGAPGTKGEYGYDAAIKYMLEDGKKFCIKAVERRLDPGTTAKLLEANAYLLDGTHVLGKDAVLVNSDVGANVSIGTGTVLKDCRVSNSIIGDNTTLEGLTIRDSVIGDNVRLSANATTYHIGDHCEMY